MLSILLIAPAVRAQTTFSAGPFDILITPDGSVALGTLAIGDNDPSVAGRGSFAFLAATATNDSIAGFESVAGSGAGQGGDTAFSAAVAQGGFSLAAGVKATVTTNGTDSIALGRLSYASGPYGAAIGNLAVEGAANAIQIGAGSNGTPFSVSLSGSNGVALNAGSSAIFIATNAVVAPLPLPNGDWLWNSNHVLYWITGLSTDYVAGLNL